MSNPKLINQLKEKNPNLNKSEIKTIIKLFLDNMAQALREGKEIEFRHFGKLYFRKLKKNFKARNPKTNELIYKPERIKLKFKASNTLKKQINR